MLISGSKRKERQKVKRKGHLSTRRKSSSSTRCMSDREKKRLETIYNRTIEELEILESELEELYRDLREEKEKLRSISHIATSAKYEDIEVDINLTENEIERKKGFAAKTAEALNRWLQPTANE